MIKLKCEGNFKKSYNFLTKVREFAHMELPDILKQYGERGVRELAAATPKDTGITASMWRYELFYDPEKDFSILSFHNDSVSHTSTKGWEPNIVILIQNGHATRNGGWVPPNDFITPVIDPLFESLKRKVWREAKDK